MSLQTDAPPAILYTAAKIGKGIQAMAASILERHGDPSGLALVGVHSGGDLLVRRLEAALARLSGQKLSLDKGLLDIAFYRDDWSRLNQVPAVRATDIPFDVKGRELVLIDDVLFTGRTIRASLEAIFSLGRPRSVELAVLVDRGHREFPIQPDHMGLRMATKRHQSINVYLFEDALKDHATLEHHKYQTPKSESHLIAKAV